MLFQSCIHKSSALSAKPTTTGSHLPIYTLRPSQLHQSSSRTINSRRFSPQFNLPHSPSSSLSPQAAANQQQEAYTLDDDDVTVIDTRIPVTVITGFLGSGKTTLLNNILTKGHGHRIAIIENEFGEIDIDSDLVSIQENLPAGSEQILMLNNGCLCCTVRDDLIEMLEKLITRRSDFDRIIIETTGLADPAPIIQTFFLEPSISEDMKLDGVVTLVDAKHIGLHLDDEKPKGVVNEALQQIAYADRIILNKTDLLSSSSSSSDTNTTTALDDLEARIKSINSLAPIYKTNHAAVPVDYVLGVGGFDLEKVDDQITSTTTTDDHSHSHDHSHEDEHSHDDHDCGDPNCTHSSHDDHNEHGEHSHDEHSHSHHSHSHDHHHHHHHDDAVTSVSVTIQGDLNLDKVNYWLGGLLEIRGNDLYRLKGVLAIDGFDRRFVFQGVHMLFEGMPDRLWKEGEERVSKMVFIGKDLDKELIEEGFLQCVVGK